VAADGARGGRSLSDLEHAELRQAYAVANCTQDTRVRAHVTSAGVFVEGE
jgi:hypothetical protein